MSVTHKRTRTLRVGTTLSSTVSITGSLEAVLDKGFANGSQNTLNSMPYTAASIVSAFILSDQAATIRVNGTNEIQSVTITGSPTGGTFTLTWSGQTTGTIAYNATATTVQAALVALSNIGTGNVSVTGANGGPWSVTFTGTLGLTNVAAMTASGAGLTGGSSPSVTIATPTPGVAPDQTIVLTAGLPIDWQTGDQPACPLTANATSWSITNTSGAQANLSAHVLTS